MNKEQLEIAKKIAEIEGWESTKTGLDPNSIVAIDSKGYCFKYNPFNWDILGTLMIKYRIMRKDNYFYFLDESGILNCRVYADEDKDIPRAILECIIKSKGLVMKIQKIRLNYELWVTCPNCGKNFDLIQTTGADDDNQLSGYLFDNKWDEARETVACKRCDQEFEVHGIEY